MLIERPTLKKRVFNDVYSDTLIKNLITNMQWKLFVIFPVVMCVRDTWAKKETQYLNLKKVINVEKSIVIWQK